MTIAFKCPMCNQPIAVPDHAAGTTGWCPRCRGLIVAPDPRAVAMTVYESSQKRQARRQVRTEDIAWSPPQWIASFAQRLLASLIALVCLTTLPIALLMPVVFCLWVCQTLGLPSTPGLPLWQQYYFIISVLYCLGAFAVAKIASPEQGCLCTLAFGVVPYALALLFWYCLENGIAAVNLALSTSSDDDAPE